MTVLQSSSIDKKKWYWFAVPIDPKLLVLKIFYSRMQFLVSWQGQVPK